MAREFVFAFGRLAGLLISVFSIQVRLPVKVSMSVSVSVSVSVSIVNCPRSQNPHVEKNRTGSKKTYHRSHARAKGTPNRRVPRRQLVDPPLRGVIFEMLHRPARNFVLCPPGAEDPLVRFVIDGVYVALVRYGVGDDGVGY